METTQEKKEQLYDANASNRFEYTVTEDGVKYDTAHLFGPISDERYVQYLNEFKISGDEDNINEEGREASVRLWDALIKAVEGVKYDEGSDWKQFIPVTEKTTAIADLLAVAINDGDDEKKGVQRDLGPKTEQVVFTECLSNGDILKQKHVLAVSTFELEKKYARIAGKRFKQTAVRGFRKKNKIEYIPQDKAFGELYDEMHVSTHGFVGDNIPLRFKTAVIHYVFASKVEAKNLGK